MDMLIVKVTKRNMEVSKRRTEVVQLYLKEQGIKALVESKNFDESRPAMSNETYENAIFNRRVQVRVYLK